MATALLLAAALAGSIQTEGRYGRPAPDLAVVPEVQVDAALAVAERGADLGAAAGYEPRLVLTEGRALDVLHSGHVAFDARPSRTLTLGLAEVASYGLQDLSPLAAASNAVPVVEPAQRFVAVVGSTTTLRAAQAVSQRLRWSGAAAYLWGGGVGAHDRAVLPQSRQPSLTAQADYVLSRVDKLGGSAEALASDSDNGAKATVSAATLSLAHSFERRLSATVGAGLSYTWTRPSPLAPAVSALLPNVDVALRSEEPLRGQRLSGTLHARVLPFLDPLTGTALTLADTGAELAWDPAKDVTLSAQGTYSRVVQGPLTGSRTLQGEARLALRLGSGVQLATGLRGADVHPEGQGALALGAGTQWTAYAQVRWDGATPARR